MHVSRNLTAGKRKYLIGLILLSFIYVICVAFTMADSDDFDIARREVLLRRIGHELLLQSGDSTTQVESVIGSFVENYEPNYMLSTESSIQNDASLRIKYYLYLTK